MGPISAKRTTEAAVLRGAQLAAERWLVHGFSTRNSPAGGKEEFNLGLVADADAAVIECNRREFARAVGGEGRPLVQVRQVHSDVIHVVERVPDAALTGDGLVTRVPGLLLAVKVADCVPVLVADRRQRAVGAFHAGWRGTVKRIVEKGVGVMRREFGSDPADLVAAIGPCIRACCYAVGDEVREEFASQFSYADELFEEHFDVDPVRQKYPNLFLTARAPGHAEISRQVHLDLAKANRRQLIDAGVPEENIGDLGLCTACRVDLLFSHRAEQGKTGRLMAAIGVRE